MNREAPSAPAVPRAASERLALVEALKPCTPRQLEVAYWLAEGKRCAEIALLFEVSSKTVEDHLQAIYAMLGVEGATAAVAAIHHAIEDSLCQMLARALAEPARPRRRQGAKKNRGAQGTWGPSRTAV